MTGAEATLLAGLVGGGSAVLAAGLATFGTYKVTTRSITAQTAQAREARLADAYIDLLWLVHNVMIRVEATRPRVVLSPEPELPEFSSAEEARIRARVRAIGSAPVRNQLQQWQATVMGFRFSVGELDQMAGTPGGPKPASAPVELWAPISKEMNDARERLRGQAVALERAVRAELTGQADDSESDAPTRATTDSE